MPIKPWRASFLQLLLLAFLCITSLLGGIALRAVLHFEALVQQSSTFAKQAISHNAALQSLNENTTTMERLGRQSVIFNDAFLRQGFNESQHNALLLLRNFDTTIAPSIATAWQAQIKKIEQLMQGSESSALEREQNTALAFRSLVALNGQIAQQVQHAIATQGQALADRLETSRRQTIRLVFSAIVCTLLLVIPLGFWLVRPFKRLEKAIVDLGENRLEKSIDIQGPSDVRRIGQQLEWLRLQLTELDADKSRFLRHISHELKTPLAAIREGVSLLEDEVAGTLSQNQGEVVQILNQNSHSLQNQIEALLEFNAVAFAARHLKREHYDLHQLLAEQIAAQKLQWQARNLTVTLDGANLRIPIDVTKMAIVIANLLSNAIRFSPQRGTIRITTAHHVDSVQIDIQDQGLGIATIDRARIFEPFYRGQNQPNNATKGTGIGLSIVQEYVAAHGGTICLLENTGAHFQIKLPHVA